MDNLFQIPVVIFCGGRGTRLKEETEIIPKPMVRIGEYPILWHIMKIYYSQGFRKFVLLVGYKGEKIKEYFHRYPAYRSDFTIKYRNGAHEIVYHDPPKEEWEVTVVDTGLDAEAGARLKRAERYLKGKSFLLTYGDGVADVNLKELINFHKDKNTLATVTGVHPPARFGEMETDGHLAVNFWEKVNTQASFINGGFFAIDPEIFSYLSEDPKLNFEKDVLPVLARDRKLSVFPHHGFWQCMDTLRDVERLNEEWQSGSAPWKIWEV